MTEETINTLCEKFHTTVDNLIPVYSEYAMIKDIANGFICFGILIVCILILIFMFKRGLDKGYYDDILDTPFSYILIPICAGIAGLICFIAICCNIYDYILWNNYPQLRFLDVVVNM